MFTQRSQVVGKSAVIPPSVCTTPQAFVHQKNESSDQFPLGNFADPWRVVWEDGHLLLCEAQLWPCPEHDWQPWEGVVTWRAPPCLTPALCSWDPGGCAEPASSGTVPAQAALHRGCPALRPGEWVQPFRLHQSNFTLYSLRISWRV